MSVVTIALTGGIGSGKTFVSKIFRLMGIPIYNSDDQAKIIMTNNPKVKSKLSALLGKETYLKDGILNKDYISKKIFSDSELLKKVNKIVHPAVRQDFEKWSKSNLSAPYVINEAALFIENGTFKSFNGLISVLAPRALRIKRTQERNNLNEEEILKRINNQSSDKEKIIHSDYLIYNDYSTCLLRQCSEIHHKIIDTQVKK